MLLMGTGASIDGVLSVTLKDASRHVCFGLFLRSGKCEGHVSTACGYTCSLSHATQLISKRNKCKPSVPLFTSNNAICTTILQRPCTKLSCLSPAVQQGSATAILIFLVSVGHIGADELLLGLTACLWYAKCFLLCTVMSKP